MKKRIRELMEKADGEPVAPSLEMPNIGYQASNMPKGSPEREAYDTEREEKKFQMKPNSATVALTFEQLQQLMMMVAKQNSADNREALVEAIRELKKPTDEEQAKIDETKARREKFMAAMIESAKAEEANKIMIRRACNHLKPNGIKNYGGQVHGKEVILICKTCFSELVRRPAVEQDYQMGPLELLVENQKMGLNA